MTVRRIHETPKLIGLSSDTKPEDSIIGTEFLEWDTKLIWITYDKIAGVAQWALK